MGDHRASIKIEFTFHADEPAVLDAWYNWDWSGSCSECHGVDQRIIDFFRAETEKGMDRYYEECESSLEKKRDAQKQERRLLYEELKKEFGGEQQ